MDSFVPVPLPNEMPFPPDLSQLPVEVLHSGTVEMLIQQNEDLSSRLKVNIRRSARYEQEIFALKSSLQELENLKSQNELFREKDLLWQNKKKELEETIESYKKEMDLLNLKYSELHDSMQTQISELEANKTQIEKALTVTKFELDNSKISHKNELEKIFNESHSNLNLKMTETEQRYQALLAISATKLRRLKNIIAKAKKRFKEYNIDYKQIKKDSAKYKEDTQLYRTKIEDLCLHIQKQENDARKIQAQLVENYEERIASFEAAIKSAKTQLTENSTTITDLKAQTETLTKKHNQVSSDKVNIENRLINHQREVELKLKTQEDQMALMHKELSKLRSENKSLAMELESKNETINKSEAHIYELKKDTHNLEEQLEGLRMAWTDTQRKFEQEKLKSESLVKINQNLSQQLKQQRRMPANAILAPNPTNSTMMGSKLESSNPSQARRDVDQRLSDLYRNTYKGPK